MSSNWMELGLSAADEEFVRRNAELYRKVYVETIDTIFDWAKAIEILRRHHKKSGIQGGFAAALVQFGFTARDGGPMNKAIVSHFKGLHDNEPKVRAWWASVPDKKKRDWLSAKAIYSHWQASFFIPKATPKTPSPPSPQPAKPSVPTDDAEVAALKARVAELHATHNADTARIRELEDKLALARIGTNKLPESVAELVAHRRVYDEVRKAEAAARKAAQPKIVVPEDETIETLADKLQRAQQQLKAARSRIRNLNVEVEVLASRTTLVINADVLSAIRAGLAPDNFQAGTAAFKRAEKAAQAFGSLNIKERGKPDQELKK